MDYVIGIRCFNIGQPEVNLFKTLREFTQESRIFFLVDNRRKLVQTSSYQIIEIHQYSNHYSPPPDWGWRCGDYWFYSFKREVNADRYYLIEPDVTFQPATGLKIINYTQEADKDFSAFNLGEAKNNWYWEKTITPLCASVYKCAFPFTALTRRAIEFLDNKRAVTSLEVKHPSLYPNDEAFVASMISSSENLTLQSLNSIPGINLSRFSTVNARPFDLCNDEGFIYHSALLADEFTIKLEKIIKKIDEPHKQYAALEFSLSGAKESFIHKVLDQATPTLRERIVEWKSAAQ